MHGCAYGWLVTDVTFRLELWSRAHNSTILPLPPTTTKLIFFCTCNQTDICPLFFSMTGPWKNIVDGCVEMSSSTASLAQTMCTMDRVVAGWEPASEWRYAEWTNSNAAAGAYWQSSYICTERYRVNREMHRYFRAVAWIRMLPDSEHFPYRRIWIRLWPLKRVERICFKRF